MPPLAEIVDVDNLLEVVWVSLVAGIGATAAYAFAILGAARALDLSRSGRPAEAVLFGAMCAIALTAVGAAVVYGIVIMTNK
ncbi:MAG TPA: hypothetical protein VKB17_05460 [Thermoleophilaceae bacterium]|nr:hypothetical protein [Thermoleophilaceae bacterium]